MAITLENLIDLPLLTYYDENLKKWVAGRIDKTLNNTAFVNTADLPVEGKSGVLYVTETSIKYWNGERYVDVGNPQETSDATVWGKF